MSMQNLSLFIFDWSGVISDDRKPVYETNMRILQRYGKPRITFDEWLPRTTLSVREFFANHGVNGNSDELFEQYRLALNQVRKEGVHPVLYFNAVKTLQALFMNGKKLVVVSSHPEKNLKEEAREYGIERYFISFIGNSKDKAKGIIEACERVSITPSPKHVTYIGDTIYDIQAAKKADVYSIGITHGYHTKDRLRVESPNEIIEDLAQLIKFGT